jgi:AraC family L-rhamnose operon regulatory protein RhaS
MPAHGVFVLESRHAPGFRMGDSAHDFLEVFYVLDGAGAFVIDARTHACAEGDVVVVPTGATHRIADDPARPMSLYGIGVAPRVFAVEPDVAALPPGVLGVTDLAGPAVRAALRQMLYEQALARPGYRAVLAGLTLHLLGTLLRGGVSVPKRTHTLPADADHLTAVKEYAAGLRERFYEPATLDGTAKALGMSRRRFTQLFREVTGASWLDHLTTLRVDYAKDLLRDPSRSVIAAAFECGFEDLSSFYRAFKRRTGQPPNEWRKAQA